MSDKPSILLVFANPKGDLGAIKAEMNAITKILRFAKLQKTIDFDSYENEKFVEIIKYTPAASIFHFSGHANEQQLLLTEDASSVNAICDLLKLSKTKLLFLNGCSTKGFLEKVFTETKVIAAIATNNKVKDNVAAELSVMFYDRLMWGDDLDTVFRKMRSSFEQRAKILHWEGCWMRDLELPESNFPDEKTETFQWGLFYKEKTYGKITIHNLLEKGDSAIDKLDEGINKLKNELVEATNDLQELKQLKNSERGLKLYNEQKKSLEAIQSKLKDQEDARKALIKEQQDEDESAKKKKLKEEFNIAIKNLNYTKQRSIYKKGTCCDFACYAAAGDEDALIDLLLIRLEEDYGFQDNNHTPIVIDYSSAGSQELWAALADKLDINKQETPEKIAGVLINDLFLGNRLYSQQHIFLKIYISQVPLEKIEVLVCDFWTNVLKACDQSGAFTNKENIRHKIVLILIDEMSTNERHDQIKAITKTVNTRLTKTELEPMPWIEPLNLDRIESWIDYHTLDRVGIQSAMANAIYTESNNGKIRKVLESVQRRCTLPDLDLFHKLNILPDDAQTILGQIGKR